MTFLATYLPIGAIGPGVASADTNPGWSNVRAATPQAVNGSLSAVSCVQDWCIAVGQYRNPRGIVAPIAESLSGQSWVAQPIAVPQQSAVTSLRGISCVTSKLCMAVGSVQNASGENPLSEEWNGVSWSVVTALGAPSASGAYLDALSCLSSTFCLAVGAVSNNSETFAEVWNGRSWSVASTPQLFASPSPLLGVSCTSSKACIAVGSQVPNGYTNPLAERWDGTTWTVLSTSSVAGSALDAVSCTAANACTAVGAGAGGAALVTRWDGTTWTAQIPTQEGSADYLDAVDCVTDSVCVAVGQYSAPPLPGQLSSVAALSMIWDGTTWTLLPAPSPDGSTNTNLDGVSCAKGVSCAAVGAAQASTALATPIVTETLVKGGWASQGATQPSGASTPTMLKGASCVTPAWCAGVGTVSVLPNGASATFAETWNGSGWMTVPAPNIAGSDASQLLAVSCTSTSACLAVGSYSIGNSVVDLVESWNGRQWSIASSPTSVGFADSTLAGVSCSSATVCTAVGWESVAGLQEFPFAANMNGGTWTTDTPPLPASTNSAAFDAVSCASAAACVAVGYADTSAAYIPLAERWNGGSWTLQSPVNPGGQGVPILESVSCPSPKSCEAVGSFTGDNGYAAFAEGWNGNTWVLQTLPAQPTGVPSSDLKAVSCLPNGDCAAVGFQYKQSGASSTLAGSWNARAWSTAQSENPPNLGDTAAWLNAVSCVKTVCVAVGQANSIALVEEAKTARLF
jgi:hypothetical protein